MGDMINIEEIQARLKLYNLRKISEEIGIHENTLYRFMNSRDPRYSTVKKINAWFDREDKS
jgi:predicted transcriptional regulator